MISSLTSRFEFTNRRGLFLSAHKAAVYQWQQGKLGSSYLFDVTEEGRDHFERYLKETVSSPFHILIDVFEEEFRRETIPHVFGPDRSALIQRRQERLFRNTPYCRYEIQGREEEGRRDDRILLTAITNAGLLNPWVELLDKHKIPLAGIHSVPLFTGSLLKLIPEPSERMLIVSLQSVSGLRQTFYLDDEFKISRLVQMPRYGTEPYAPYISGEVEKIRRYINSLRLTGQNEPLDIYFLATGDLLGELKQEHTNSEDVRYHSVDLKELSETGDTLKTVSTPFSDQFFMHNLLNKPPGNCYATASNTRYASMRRMRYSMLTTAVLLMVGSVVWSGFNLVNALSYKQRSLAAQSKAQFYETRYQIARERLPQTPVEPADLQVAVELYDTLRDYKTTPLETIKLISKGLNRFPKIRLSDVQWASSLDPNFNVGQSADTAGPNIVDYSNVSFNKTGYRFYQVSMINGYIEPFDGNFREAISLINEFAEILRTQKSAYDVSIVSLPLDISSTSSLNGDVKETGESAKFSMRIVLGIGDEE